MGFMLLLVAFLLWVVGCCVCGCFVVLVWWFGMVLYFCFARFFRFVFCLVGGFLLGVCECVGLLIMLL